MVKLAKAAKKPTTTPKKKAPPPPKDVDSNEEEDSSEEENEEVPPPKASAKKAATPAKVTKAAKNGKVAQKQESDEDDEEDAPPVPAKGKAAKGKAAPLKKAAKAKKQESEEEDDDDDESEEEAPPPKKATPAKATPAKKAAPAKKQESEEEDDDDEDDDESEEEAPPPKKATPAKATPAKKAAPAKKQESEEEDDDEDDEESEEEAPPPKKATQAKSTPAKKTAPAKKEESEEEDDDEDDDEEDDSEDEQMDTTPAPAAKAKKAGMVKAKEESEEEDDEEDDDEEDDEDEEESDEEEPAQTPGKRKKPEPKKKETPPAKKAKSEQEGLSAFVGNLNSDKNFDELKEALGNFFSKNNLQAQDVRIAYSKKFGYVDFATEEDLQKALELNGKKLLGLELRVDKARSKQNAQQDRDERDSRTLFAKNLPFSITQEELREVFQQAVDIRLLTAKDGSSKGIAYIEFETEAVAEKVLEEKQGADVQGRSIILDYSGKKSQKGPRMSENMAGKTLVVNNLAYSATEESLQSTFEKAVAVRVPQNNGRAKGYAFIDFENAEDAKEALEMHNNTDIEGRTIRLEYSKLAQKSDGGRGSSGPTKTLFVRGLSEDTTDQTLKDSFEGSVAARIVTDKDGSSKGFGFVDFDSEQDCKAAKEAMEDCEIDGSRVTLDYAKPKGEGQRGGGRGGFGGFGGRGGGGRGGRGGFGRGGGFRGGRGGNRGGFGGT
ncbi:NUCL protein, partial [Atractosteus spatula]|nr:NUCL protein [Atractosteus spatula]